MPRITIYRSSKAYLSAPYDLLKDNRIKLLFSVALPLIYFLFLWFLGPFGLALFPPAVRLTLIGSVCVAGSAIFAFHLYILQKIFIKTYNVGTTALWLLWIHSVVAVSNLTIYSRFAAGHTSMKLVAVDSSNFLASFPSMMFQTFLIGLLPTVIVVVLYNSFLLRKKITVVNAINTGIRESLKRVPEMTSLSLYASNLREVITVTAESLTYITSQENYIDVHWTENGREKHGLLRSTLSKAEKDIARQCEFIKRCHHGFIVNLHRVTSLAGNEAGYKLQISGSDLPIPISKKYKKIVLQSLHR